jgi:Ca-activated chloride channel family protein
VLPLLPAPAMAATWSDLWRRPDQQAAQALRDGHAKQAQQLAHDPAWRGAAAYRAGDFAAAAQALRQAPGGDAAYNLGNALARQGEYRQAIAAYDDALKLDPANADATANRKAVQQWLEQQRKKRSSPDQTKHDGQGSGKGSSSSGEQGKQNPQQQKSAQDGSGSSGQNGQQDKSRSQESSGKDDSGQHETEAKPQTAQQQAAQKAQAEQARQALKKQMDQVLAGKPQKPAHGTAPHQLGAMAAGDPQSKLPADLQHALQRVPDDPGALLRRKFELEYQQRHGGAPDEDGQP